MKTAEEFAKDVETIVLGVIDDDSLLVKEIKARDASIRTEEREQVEKLIPDPKYLVYLADLLQEFKEEFDEDQEGYISCQLESAQLHLMAEKIQAALKDNAVKEGHETDLS